MRTAKCGTEAWITIFVKSAENSNTFGEYEKEKKNTTNDIDGSSINDLENKNLKMGNTDENE